MLHGLDLVGSFPRRTLVMMFSHLPAEAYINLHHSISISMTDAKCGLSSCKEIYVQAFYN